MSTLRQYFDVDFSNNLKVAKTFVLTAGGLSVEGVSRLHLNFDANAKHMSYYLPELARADLLDVTCRWLIDHVHDDASVAEAGVQIQMGYLTDTPRSAVGLVFTQQVTFYIDLILEASVTGSIVEYGLSKGVFVQIRDKRYAMAKSETEKPVAFISHDSRDKEQIARPLTLELIKLMHIVWYDEFALKVGDSLRESIEKGIKECKKCVLVLSPHFLNNPGWSKREFDSIFTRELIEQQNVILPVWAGVTKEQVYQYSPSLADRLAADWSEGYAAVARKLSQALRT